MTYSAWYDLGTLLTFLGAFGLVLIVIGWVLERAEKKDGRGKR